MLSAAGSVRLEHGDSNDEVAEGVAIHAAATVPVAGRQPRHVRPGPGALPGPLEPLGPSSRSGQP